MNRFQKTLRDWRFDLRPPIYVLGLGSSVGVGATLPFGGYSPVGHFCKALNERIGPIFAVQPDNRSANGSVIFDADAVLTGFVAEGKVPALVVLAYDMPAGLPQIYPTSIPANVPDESLSPKVSESTFYRDGVRISHRHLRINQAMRSAAANNGAYLLDVEPVWFDAVKERGEENLFNASETVHPNLLGHQQSYWKAIDSFLDKSI